MEYTLQQLGTGGSDCECARQYSVSKDFIETSETLSNLIGDVNCFEDYTIPVGYSDFEAFPVLTEYIDLIKAIRTPDNIKYQDFLDYIGKSFYFFWSFLFIKYLNSIFNPFS